MTDLAAIPLTRIDGSADSLGNHAGKVLLVVNVASKCGLTPQYEGLEKLYQAKKDRGFAVLGFPANDFGAQEPGSHAEIQEFCKLNYGVSFPLFAKADVTGPDKQPLYAALTSALPEKQGPNLKIVQNLLRHAKPEVSGQRQRSLRIDVSGGGSEIKLFRHRIFLRFHTD